MKKFITLLLCVAMVMSMLVVPASADEAIVKNINFTPVEDGYNNGSDYLKFDPLAANDTSWLSFAKEADGSAATSITKIMHYENGIFGRSSSDTSQVLRISGDTTTAHTVTNGAWYYINLEGGSNSNKGMMPAGDFYEFSVAMNGDVQVQIQAENQGATVVQVGDTKLDDCTITPDDYESEWVRVTIWATPELDDGYRYYKVFVNGIEKTQVKWDPDTIGTNAAIWRVRLRVTVDESTTADGIVAIDDYIYKTGVTSYTPIVLPELESIGEKVRYTDDKLGAASGTTVADLASEISVENGYTYEVYDASIANQKTGDAEIAVGDVIVMHNDDYTIMRYIKIVSIEAVNLIKFVDFENEETLGIGNGADLASLTYTPGLYGKAADDDALVLVPNGAPNPRLGISDIEALNTSSSLCVADDFEAETVTAEISVAINDAYGDFNVSILPQYKPNDVTGWEYANTYRMNNEIFKVVDGKINASHLAPGYVYDFPAEQWLRVAITIKPETEKYDLYINGFLARQDGPLGGDTNTKWVNSSLAEDWKGTTEDKWQYVGLNELRIMGYTTSGESSEIAVDDLKVYYGEYAAKDKITVSGYTVDCDNVLVMDDGVTLTKAMVESAVNEGCTVAEYGNGFVVSKGFVKRYFTGAAKSITVNNDDIKLYDANGELTEIAAGSRIYAHATPEYVGYRPVLILAVYEGDELLTIRLATGLGSDFKTGIYQVADDADVANLSVKAMLWDGFDNIKPYVEAIAVPAN